MYRQMLVGINTSFVMLQFMDNFSCTKQDNSHGGVGDS